MTERNNNGNDRIETHYRLQLSALMDGALPPDEARFLLRRMQHDTELGGCWERWQMAGEALRGRAAAPLPADFSQRVAAAVASEPAPARASSTQMPRWARWSGGALAASVALVAVFMARQQAPADAIPGNVEPAQVVVASSSSATPAPVPAPVAPASPVVDPQAGSALAATAIAVAEVPRRAASRRASSRSQSQRAALRAPSRNNADLQIAVAANAPASNPPAAATSATPPLTLGDAAASTEAIASSDPFASQPIAPSRPWPSAVLPQYAASGALNVDYGATSSYYPFQPRLPASPPAADAELETQDAPQP